MNNQNFGFGNMQNTTQNNMQPNQNFMNLQFNMNNASSQNTGNSGNSTGFDFNF